MKKKTYFPENLTICLDITSFTAIIHCTVQLCCLKIRKHCLPLLLEVCTRPRTHTDPFSTYVDRSDTFTKTRSLCLLID